ncbi:heavy-metal-associated domain-containing protein [Butyrivibrio sp. CB08]|uniref:heavy-metal-associated domain-containing protein n=1 Tax=Butyrivibrio sp. CB08 TaxID=2364879 RepID=UPI000EAA48DB|nr:heavy metal-associated domain-containing protein [Butyrivibrio sp. CB08]RKM61314.1 heavy-metal-associated domain-containing protein [Butyrivibrio sp. CB08]
MANAIIVVILAVIFAAATKGAVKHLMGQGSCCGGGSSTVKEPDKKLSGPAVKTKVFKIDGMHCENCTNRVKRAINRIDGVSARLNLRKKQAVVEYDRDVDDDEIIKAIEALDYKVVSVIEK